MKVPSLLEMLQAGMHFGHKKSRWHPKMRPFIFTERNGVHIINLEKTQVKLAESCEAAKKMAAEGKKILFITTKPHAREIVREAAQACGMPYLVDRWIGGMLTNFDEIKKLLQQYKTLKEQKASGELERYTKKERVVLEKKLEKMDKTLAGLSELTSIPDALFIPTMQREKTAVTEALRTGVEIIGVCDTNANPNKADYIIPANDDALNALKMVSACIRDAVLEGNKKAAKHTVAPLSAAGTGFGVDKKLSKVAKPKADKAQPKSEKIESSPKSNKPSA